MIEHAWTVLCRKAIVDPQTNNATLVETIDQITATAEPIHYFQVEVQSEGGEGWRRVAKVPVQFLVLTAEELALAQSRVQGARPV